MLDVLTDQVAGLYDPKAKEFYIADWIPVDEQRTVMSHELTHALEDQSFHIDSWIKAARPNDDAELARDAVSEGSAMAAMVDYEMLDQKVSVRDVPDVTLLIRASALSEMDKDPNLAKAPRLYSRRTFISVSRRHRIYAAIPEGPHRMARPPSDFSGSAGIHATDPASGFVPPRRETRNRYAAGLESPSPSRLEAAGRKHHGGIRSKRGSEAAARRKSRGIALPSVEGRPLRCIRGRQSEVQSAGVPSGAR